VLGNSRRKAQAAARRSSPELSCCSRCCCGSAIWSWRGGYRYAAIVPLPFLLLAYAVDLNGFLQGGNLLTIFAAVPTLLLLLVLSAAQGFAKPVAATPDRSNRVSQRVSMVVLTLLVLATIGLVIFVLLPR
jgi:hypothetical protein